MRIRLNVYAPSEFVIYNIDGFPFVDIGRLIMSFNIIDADDWRLTLRICADLGLHSDPAYVWTVEPASQIMQDLWRN